MIDLWAAWMAGLADPPIGERGVGCVLALVYYTLIFGACVRWLDGEPPTLPGVVADAAVFGVVATLANQLWIRRLHRETAG